MTAVEKQYVARWNELVKEILALTVIDTTETDEEREERVDRLEADPEEWFRYYFPRYVYAAPAGFHKEATRRTIENMEWYEVRMWSRELAKSTRTMMEVLYLTLVGHPLPRAAPGTVIPLPAYPKSNAGVTAHGQIEFYPRYSVSAAGRQKKRCVLLISNSLDNATRLLMPYKANLEYNQRIIQDYGVQEGAGNWQAGEFITQYGVAFRALGAGQSPRGTRNEEVRPDIILFDDVDTDADCLNPEIVAKKWRWIEEAAIGTRSISQSTTIIFCGNRIAPDCCIERATKLADHVDVINIRDEHGHSAWPQKNAEVDIDRVLMQKSYAAAQKEYFNNPLIEGSVFKEMAYKPSRPLSDYKFLVCYTDPSYKATNDYKATVLVGKWQDEYHIIKCFLEQTTTAAMIAWHYNIMDIVGYRTCYYFMEEVFIQDVIRKEVAAGARELRRNIPLGADRRKKPDKFMRIESLLEPLHRNGQLYLNENERHNPNMERLAEQFVAFAPGSHAHDDGPDAVEGAIWIINEKESKGIGEGIIAIAKPLNENRL